MINQVAVEALYSATYVENYLDYVENLPDDVQRHLSRIREIDVQYRSYLRDVDIFYEQWSNCSSNEVESNNTSKRTRAMARIQQSLISAQELGDEKLQIVTQLQELIDHKTRQLDHDFKNLDYGKDEPGNDLPQKELRIPSPPLVSPLNTVTGVAQQLFNLTTISPATINTTNDRNLSNNNNNNNSNNSNSERTSKRARRTRTDTGTGMEIGVSDANINSDHLLIHASQQTTTASTTSSAAKHTNSSTISNQTNSTTQKKGAGGSGKKKKRKTRAQNNNTCNNNNNSNNNNNNNNNNQTNNRDTRNDTPPPEETIDPDEPTYCLCDQISFGEMILCDNDLCPIEWFHFSCVSLMSKPKGKWFCPNCRGDRPNAMKPKAQFLKELERYNKEKEEKT